MTTLIAQELESEALHRFHADFRRALLMHRKASLNLFFRLQFPMAESPLYEGDWSVEHLGIVRWLAEPPPHPQPSAHFKDDPGTAGGSDA